jgi:Reverse transcriptase (RNA-dependent DNA polymerase)
LDHLSHGAIRLSRQFPTTHDISNVLVYIDDLLVHKATHEKHLQVLDQVLARLHKNHLKINLDKCVFGNKEVSYLGFTLMLERIKPGKNKLKAIKDAKLVWISRRLGPSWACETSSGRTSRTLC